MVQPNGFSNIYLELLFPENVLKTIGVTACPQIMLLSGFTTILKIGFKLSNMLATLFLEVLQN